MKTIEPSNPPVLLSSAEQTLEEIKQHARSEYRRHVEGYNNGLAFVWSNSRGLTPQEVCDAGGVNASAWFRDHGAVATLIWTLAAANDINPLTGKDSNGRIIADEMKIPTHNWTINPDGTVTILNTPFTP